MRTGYCLTASGAQGGLERRKEREKRKGREEVERLIGVKS